MCTSSVNPFNNAMFTSIQHKSQPKINIEVTQEKPQQLKEFEIQDVATQEPTPLETLVEVVTQLKTFRPVVETIPDYNLGDLEETLEQSQDIELIQEEVQQEEDVFTQKPASPKFSVKDTVQTEDSWDGTQKRDTVTQEPVFLKSLVDVATQTQVAT